MNNLKNLPIEITNTFLNQKRLRADALVDGIAAQIFHQSNAREILFVIKTANDFFPDKPADKFLSPIMNHLLGRKVAEILEIPYSEENNEVIALLKLKNTFKQS